MGNNSMSNLPQIVSQLLSSKQISQTQSRNILKDLKSQQNSKNIQSILQKTQLKDLLKLYIQAHYFDDEMSYETKKQQKQIDKQNKQIDLKNKIKSFQNNQIIKEFTVFFQNFKEKYKVAIRLLSEIVCYQNGKTQSCITKLLDILMNIQVYSYFKFTGGNANGTGNGNGNGNKSKSKIEYFDSSLNYLTIYLEEEIKFKEIMKSVENVQEGLYNEKNERFCQLFNVKKGENVLFFVDGVGEEKLIFRLTMPDNIFYDVLKSSPDMQRTFSMFAETIIETLHRSKFQTSNVQYTVKSMIDILDFSLKMNNIVGQKRILLKIQSETGFVSNSLREYLNYRKKSDANSQETKFIEEMSENFSMSLGKFLLRINVYKTELSDSSTIFMDFDRYGVLSFISNRLPSVQYNRLRMKMNSNSDIIRIQDIFKENSKMIMNFKTAFNGLVVNEPIHFHEDGYPGELTFAYDGDNQLVRTHIHIFLKETKRTQSSNKNILSVKSIISSQSQKDVNKVIKETTGINNAARKRIIDIETQNPGVTKHGWLELFVKHDVIDKYKKTFQDDDKESFNKTISVEVLDENQSLYSVSPQLINRIDIDNPDLNLLELDSVLYIPFVEKVFKNNKYFVQSKFNPLLFQNFIFELQRKYDKHNNTFHNFVHGMNVMHYTYLLTRLPKITNVLSDLEVFTLIWSGLCHDVGHRGYNNSFQIATLSKKAVRWNDKSPLQNYHISKAFKILLKPNNNFLQNQKKEQFIHFRKLAIANVLATDIKEHFPIVTNFENKIKSSKGLENNPADVQLLSTFLMHTSDFSGASKYYEISQKWSRLCIKQFANQYKEEGILGIPQTPFMKDLDNEAILSKNQAGFLKVIVRPLFKGLNDFLIDEPMIKRMLDNIDTTILVWEKIAQSGASANNEKKDVQSKQNSQEKSEHKQGEREREGSGSGQKQRQGERQGQKQV